MFNGKNMKNKSLLISLNFNLNAEENKLPPVISTKSAGDRKVLSMLLDANGNNMKQ